MNLLGTTKEFLCVPLRGPAGVDLTAYAAQIALVPDTGAEPAAGDWHPATWLNGEATLLVGPGGGVVYAPGNYVAYAQLTAGAEVPVMVSGRVRIGDSGTACGSGVGPGGTTLSAGPRCWRPSGCG